MFAVAATAESPPRLRVLDAMRVAEKAPETHTVESIAHTLLCTAAAGIAVTTALGEYCGMLTANAIRNAIAAGRGDLPLSALLTGPAPVFPADADLSTVVAYFEETGMQGALVAQNGRTIGILTRKSISNAVVRQVSARI